jgi:hypothetical protein
MSHGSQSVYEARFTRRNCHAFHDPLTLPNVLFYVPKRFVSYGRRLCAETFPAEALIERGEPTLLLDVEVGSIVNLTAVERGLAVRRRPNNGNVRGRGGVGGEEDEPSPNAGTLARIDTLDMRSSGRVARLQMCLVFL